MKPSALSKNKNANNDDLFEMTRETLTLSEISESHENVNLPTMQASYHQPS